MNSFLFIGPHQLSKKQENFNSTFQGKFPSNKNPVSGKTGFNGFRKMALS
jgi:hypothetical protein